MTILSDRHTVFNEFSANIQKPARSGLGSGLQSPLRGQTEAWGIFTASQEGQKEIKAMNGFERAIAKYNGEGLHGSDIETIQVNIGLKCNLECVHCHVVSSPRRKEMMDWETMEQVIVAAEKANAKLVDITGGAPEMHPQFRRFVKTVREKGFSVMVRTNLTILLEPGFETLPDFFREQSVQLCASLPCYLEENVDTQRGTGVFDGSIKALKCLNSYGYGIAPHLPLNLVYNPVGPTLPPDQSELEVDYREELGSKYGIAFTHLLTIANMPIGRFRSDLKRENGLEVYNQLLRESFNPATLDGLMCRHQINIGWDGRMYDCDFNLALKAPVAKKLPQHIKDFDPDLFARRRIVTGSYCFGCTAGSGSSCGGALL